MRRARGCSPPTFIQVDARPRQAGRRARSIGIARPRAAHGTMRRVFLSVCKRRCAGFSCPEPFPDCIPHKRQLLKHTYAHKIRTFVDGERRAWRAQLTDGGAGLLDGAQERAGRPGGGARGGQSRNTQAHRREDARLRLGTEDWPCDRRDARRPPDRRSPREKKPWRTRLVGASSLDVARLLAAVADALAGGLRRAVAGDVADFAACKKVSDASTEDAVCDGDLQL